MNKQPTNQPPGGMTPDNIEGHLNAFRDGYNAAMPHTVIQPSGLQDDWGNGWDSAITFANNLCVQISDDYNNADMVSQADTSTYCAQQIRKAHGDRSYKPEDIFTTPQSSTSEEERDLWMELIKEVERNEFLSTKYKEVIDRLQSTYKISKR